MALIPPDTATCADCVREVLDPSDRRHRYPFTACTYCGPRYTLVTGLPYDRPFTTMAGVPAVRPLRGRVRGPGGPSLPRAAHRLPGVRPAALRSGGVTPQR